MQDGASFLGRRANFNQACSLLSQFVKKGRGSFGDLNLTNSPNTGNIGSETIGQTRNLLPGMETSGTDVSDRNEMAASRNNVNSMDLFPRHAGFGVQQGAKKTTADLRPVSVTEPENAQMTIFYGGQVLVFDKFPAERAKEVIFLAGKTSSSTQNGFTSTNDQKMKPKTNNGMDPTDQNNSTQEQRALPPRPHVSEIPIARKASLHRFLEKRKDRLSAKTPYLNNSVLTHTKPAVENHKAWLGLSNSDSLNQLT